MTGVEIGRIREMVDAALSGHDTSSPVVRAWAKTADQLLGHVYMLEARLGAARSLANMEAQLDNAAIKIAELKKEMARRV
jgi:hypothetical protein